MKFINFIKNIFCIYACNIFSRYHSKDDSDYLDNAIKWLCTAQDSTNDGGVSEGYHLYHGWLPSYPETTGYIIETFFDYYHHTGNEAIKDRAIKMTDWLISIQHKDGVITDSYFQKKMVFDTGQVVFGLVRSYKETGIEKYKEAAIKAGDWLISVQSNKGSWIKYSLHSIPHTYYSRVAWSLLLLHSIVKEDKYKEACVKNIEWTIQRQWDNGWFNHASFSLTSHRAPFTHTIAYTIRGILEAGIYLDNDDYINAAVKSIDNLLKEMPSNGLIAGTYDSNWKGNVRFSCLTGNAQLAIILLKLAKIKNSEKYHAAAICINNNLKLHQLKSSANEITRGAISGSSPIWGQYIHFAYPNWACKFFADLQMLEASFK